MLNVYRYSKTGATRRKVAYIAIGTNTAEINDLTANGYRYTRAMGDHPHARGEHLPEHTWGIWHL